MKGLYLIIWRFLFITALLLIINSIVLVFSGFNLSKMFAALLGLVIILILIIDKSLRFSSAKRSFKIFQAVILLFVISFFIIESFIVFAVQRNVNFMDALIVLGAGIRGDTVTIVLQERLDTAYSYLQEHPETMLVLSGGQGPDENVAEAYAMRDYLVKKGVPMYKIQLEDKSNDTFTNFVNSKALLDKWYEGRTYVTGFVTSNFHVFRAWLTANKAGLYSQGIAAPTKWYLVPNYYIREYFAVIQFLIIGS